MLRGSNVILVPEFLKSVEEKLGGDYYLIPASSDVLLVVLQKDGSLTLSDVKTINDGFSMNRIENDRKFSKSVLSYNGSKLEIVW